MPAFVYVSDDAVDGSTCDAMITKFGGDPGRVAGRVGDGIEPKLKRSTDLAISSLEHWRDDCKRLRNVIWDHALRYAQQFPHLVVGGVLPRVYPTDGSAPVDVDARTYVSLAAASRRKIAQSVLAIGDLTLQHYATGRDGYPHWHCEIFPRRGDTTALHRVLFAIVYLNDVRDGGETEFAYQKLRVRPRAGRVVLAPAGFTHTHRGAVPTSNDKYIVTSWLVFRPSA